jgi:hypothetical protein
MSRATFRTMLVPAVACSALAVAAVGALEARGGPPAKTANVAEAVDDARRAVPVPEVLSRVRALPPVTLRRLPGDVIEVRGKWCPADHPRRVGTSSSSSSTQVNGGPVRRQASLRLLCAR